MHVEQVDFVTFLARDMARARIFYSFRDPDGNSSILHRRLVPVPDARLP